VTLSLTSDDLESHIVVNVSSTLTNPYHLYHYLVCGCIEFDCGRTDRRTDIFTGFITSSLRRWPKNQLDCAVVLIQYRLMTNTDRHTDRLSHRLTVTGNTASATRE